MNEFLFKQLPLISLATFLGAGALNGIALSLDPLTNTAGVLDTGSADQSAAVFAVVSGPGGNGTFNSFLGTDDLSNDTDLIEIGHNTSNGGGTTTQDEIQTGGQTDDVQLSSFGFVSLPGTTSGTGNQYPDPAVTINPTGLTPGTYMTIAFDANPKNNTDATLTYNALKLFISPTQVTNEFANPVDGDLGTLVWDLGVGNQLVTTDINSGSGATDLLMYFALDDIIGHDPDNVDGEYYLYLYVEIEHTLGNYNANQHGYISGDDADAIYPDIPDTPVGVQVPEPANYAFIASFVAALVVFVRRRPRNR